MTHGVVPRVRCQGSGIGRRLLSGAGQRHGGRIEDTRPSPGAIPLAGVEWPTIRPVARRPASSGDPYLAYLPATYLLRKCYPPHTSQIHLTYISHTSFMGVICMGSTPKPPEPRLSAWRSPIHPCECTYLYSFSRSSGGGSEGAGRRRKARIGNPAPHRVAIPPPGPHPEPVEGRVGEIASALTLR